MTLKSRLALVLAAAIALMPATQAVSADYNPPIYVDQAPDYQPVEVGSGWYLRGDVGYAFSHPYENEETAAGFTSKNSLFDGSIGMGYHFNDYLRGDGNCIASYSVDKGRNWTDSQIPMQFTRGATAFGVQRAYWGSGGDPSVAWDTKGNAYFSCQLFGRGRPVTQNPDLSSAVYVYRSTGNFGASWNFPGRPVIESADVTGSGVPAFEDKPYMTVDNHVGSRVFLFR